MFIEKPFRGSLRYIDDCTANRASHLEGNCLVKGRVECPSILARLLPEIELPPIEHDSFYEGEINREVL